MKKLFLLVAVAGLGLFAASCKKECKCTLADGTSWEIPADKSGNLTKENCEAFNSLYSLVGVNCKWQ